MKRALVKVTVVSIDGKANYAGTKVINSHKMVGTPWNDGTYTYFKYDEKQGDRRDPSKEYKVSESLATINAYMAGAVASDKILTDLTFTHKGNEWLNKAWAKTSGIRVKNIISAEANATDGTDTDIKYEVDAFLVEKATIDITLANLIKYANTPNYAYFDDFDSIAGVLGTTIATAITLQDYHWAVTNTNGNVAVVAEADPFNGKLTLDSSATGSSLASAAWRTALFNGALEKTFAFRFKTNNITNSEIKVGWYASANDYCYINFDTATHATNLYVASNNNNAGVQRDDTGVDMAATIAVDVSITLKGTNIIAVVNGTKVTITNCSVRDLDTFKPYIYVDNKAAAEQKLLDVDFVDISQYRV